MTQFVLLLKTADDLAYTNSEQGRTGYLLKADAIPEAIAEALGICESYNWDVDDVRLFEVKHEHEFTWQRAQARYREEREKAALQERVERLEDEKQTLLAALNSGQSGM